MNRLCRPGQRPVNRQRGGVLVFWLKTRARFSACGAGFSWDLWDEWDKNSTIVVIPSHKSHSSHTVPFFSSHQQLPNVNNLCRVFVLTFLVGAVYFLSLCCVVYFDRRFSDGSTIFHTGRSSAACACAKTGRSGGLLAEGVSIQ